MKKHKTQRLARNQSPHLPVLEEYISDICVCVEQHNLITSEIQRKAPAMKNLLNGCLDELPDFSLDFYHLIMNIILQIEEPSSYSNLSPHLLNLAKFMQSTKTPNIEIPNRIPRLSLSHITVNIK